MLSVRPLTHTSRDALCLYSSDFSHKYSREWVLRKRFSSSEIKAEGRDQTECYTGAFRRCIVDAHHDGDVRF